MDGDTAETRARRGVAMPTTGLLVCSLVASWLAWLLLPLVGQAGAQAGRDGTLVLALASIAVPVGCLVIAAARARFGS
jgi:hypothetical protein